MAQNMQQLPASSVLISLDCSEASAADLLLTLLPCPIKYVAILRHRAQRCRLCDCITATPAYLGRLIIL